jgi:hypothetical protein
MLSRRNFLTFAASTFIASTIRAHAFPIPYFQAPDVVDWFTLIGQNWRMFGNDNIGDCVEAACANAVLQWSTINGHPHVIEMLYVESLYEKLSGYIQGNKKLDVGTDMIETLEYWKGVGWNIGEFERNKLDTYSILELTSRENIKRAIYYCGGVFCGVFVPGEYINCKESWTLERKLKSTKKDSSHAIYIVGYDKHYLTFVSHGNTALMTWEFFEKYANQAYAILNPLWIKNGISPNGYKYEYLQQEMIKLDKNYAWQEMSNRYWNMK